MITKALALLLAFVTLVCVGLLWQARSLEDRLEKVQGELTVSREAARQCSEATERMSREAEEREKEARAAIEAARKKARSHNERADRHLATPGIVPGDSCASARHRLNEWWQEQGR